MAIPQALWESDGARGPLRLFAAGRMCLAPQRWPASHASLSPPQQHLRALGTVRDGPAFGGRESMLPAQLRPPPAAGF